ncbi:lipase, putative [Paecilomyces variotii No. 5]|uniref:sn-1-specific diacylglycerol lipase n=1 Tax=Byssochlamys spectabilis (strain No. 5 / NBRC 109023) TaxID=1356009 RepID=V5GA14_BYSSN|nr:lipase, putative [Paecilomyces variotii No. 5]
MSGHQDIKQALVHQDEIESNAEHDLDNPNNTTYGRHTSGNTLLPRPVASLVSLFTQSTSLSLRLGTLFGGAAIDGARVTTLTGLELSRAVIEGILTRAGRDIAIRSHGELGRQEAESLLERSLATLHSTVTSASFFASASFHLSSATLSSISNLSQNLLFALDAILGSTESSRAIAAIITLIRKEFNGMEIANEGEKVAVGDLLVGSIGFALLQRWGRRQTEREFREGGGEETVWDVVILDNGVRADVIGTQQLGYTSESQDNFDGESRRPSSFMSPGKDEETFEAVERDKASSAVLHHPHLDLSAESQHQISDEDIKRYIMSQLPRGCHASIKTETVTARTITVDIFDDDTEIAAPPGTMLIEERFHHDPSYTRGKEPRNAANAPKHTVVFRTALNRSQSADLRREELSDSPTLSGPEAGEERFISVDADNSNTRHSFPNGATDGEHSRRQGASVAHKRNRNKKPSNPALDPASDYPEEDTGKENPPPQERGEERQITSNTSRPVTHRRPRNKPSSSSLSGNEKGTFGKKSLSRIAQKVKQNPEERSENKKKIADKSGPKARSGRPSGTSQTKEKEPKDPGAERTTASHGLFRMPTSRSKPSSSAHHTPEPRVTPAVNRNKPQPRLPASPTSRSTPSPTARRHHPRDLHGRTPSRSDYYSVREKNRESFLAQTDSYSIRSVDTRPGSAVARTHLRSSSAMSATLSEKDMRVSADGDVRPGSSAIHRRSGSFAPSIYSLATAGSQASLILAPRPRRSAYDDQTALTELTRSGTVPGIFPANHLVHNVRRFCRFASASYGSSALKVMGISEVTKVVRSTHSDHHEHSSFSDHTGLPPSTILLSSFVDPEGGSNSKGETGTGFPLVHYLSIDHESKAIVLTLRGTWGFEDILTDMTCDYDDLEWQGKNWKVHKGMLASARRLLEGGGGRVMLTIKAALEEFVDYGVIFCGHSLGGGVASLLATLISEPNTGSNGPSFVTASSLSAARPLLLTADHREQAEAHMAYSLPAGRPIHVYAYGPPAVMSPFLRRATRGLITTVVNGQDVVPSLSLGILHDVHGVAQAFKTDTSGAKSHIRSRVWEALKQSITNKFYVNQPPIIVNAGEGAGDDAWAWAALKTLRAEMMAPKLVPPGEVFVVETMRVLQRDAFTSNVGNDGYLGRPATRVEFKYIRNVESLFSELRFGSGMLGDHNPARYEASLAALARGALD